MRFIDITDTGGLTHAINTSHIIEVFQIPEDDCTIVLSNGTEIYTSMTKFNILKKIDGIPI